MITIGMVWYKNRGQEIFAYFPTVHFLGVALPPTFC